MTISTDFIFHCSFYCYFLLFFRDTLPHPSLIILIQGGPKTYDIPDSREQRVVWQQHGDTFSFLAAYMLVVAAVTHFLISMSTWISSAWALLCDAPIC